eukprot:4318870-Alexandrium_andersonii.AAC.1
MSGVPIVRLLTSITASGTIRLPGIAKCRQDCVGVCTFWQVRDSVGAFSHAQPPVDSANRHLNT